MTKKNKKIGGEENKYKDRSRRVFSKASVAAIESMPIPVVVISKSFELMYANKQALALYKDKIRKIGNPVGQKCYSFFYGEKAPCLGECPVLALLTLHRDEPYEHITKPIEINGHISLGVVSSILKGEDGEEYIIEVNLPVTRDGWRKLVSLIKVDVGIQHFNEIMDKVKKLRTENQLSQCSD